MTKPTPIEWVEPTPEEKAAQRDTNRKQTICTCAMQIVALQKLSGDSLDSPRAIARKSFELAEAFWDELQARGLEIG